MLTVSLKNLSEYLRSVNAGWQEKGQEGIYCYYAINYAITIQHYNFMNCTDNESDSKTYTV